MVMRANRFPNGGSQAVRPPKAGRLVAQREGRDCREGPRDAWSPAFRACLGSIAEAIPRPRQQRLVRLPNPFD
jgi:hypothetical protein